MGIAQIASQVLLPVRERDMDPQLPPGPRWPRVAQLAAWLQRPFETLMHLREVHGSPFTLRFPNWPAIVVFDDPEVIKEIFTGPPDELYAGQANQPLKPAVGERSLLLLDGPPHLRERRLLLPPFHGARMTRYGEQMREITRARMERWPVGEPFEFQPHAQAITLDIIVQTVFGVTEGALYDRLLGLLNQLILDFSKPGLMVPWFQVDLGSRSPWGRFVRTRAETDALIYKEIHRRRTEGVGDGDDIFTMLLQAQHEDGSPMSREELRDELMTMLLAGHETTATALSWAMHHLIESPSAQRRVHEELDEVLGDELVEPERSKELRYLDAVIKETLRVLPVVAAVGRVLQQDRVIGGWRIPAGAMASPSIWLTHRNPAIYPEPDRFEPERFLDRRPSPYAFLPFGGGTRRCIGMAFALYEMRIVLATVLQRFRVARAPGARYRAVRRSVTMAPEADMPLVLTRR